MIPSRVFFGVLLGVALVSACSSESKTATTPEDPKGSCSAIATACHPYDKESTVGHDCHELGHAGDDAKCAPKRAECLAACPAKAGGHDAGHSGDDAGADAAPDPACSSYCACLDATCKAEQGYPFSAEGSCMNACAAMSKAEIACYPKWCAKAEMSGGGHDCEHAWGKLGLVECDTL